LKVKFATNEGQTDKILGKMNNVDITAHHTSIGCCPTLFWHLYFVFEPAIEKKVAVFFKTLGEMKLY
jgi:hypothetical protein